MVTNIENKTVVVIGPPGSGKTTFANQFGETHLIIHTDDYIPYGYKEALYVLLHDLEKVKFLKRPLLIEGVLGYRLLRKGVELNCFYPDVVIELTVTPERQAEIYAKERDAEKLKYLKGFARTHAKILADYNALFFNHEARQELEPEWIKQQLV